jgi:hypothetical protein
MTDISDTVLETLDMLKSLYEKTSNVKYRELLENTYFKVVDTAYTGDISKQLAYKKIWYTHKTKNIDKLK